MREFDKRKNQNIKPTKITLGQKKPPLWWRCRICKYSWQASVHLRVSRGYGCPRCARGRTKKKLWIKIWQLPA